MSFAGKHARLLVGACLLHAGVARAAQVEGPLDNDAYLPVNAAAEAELARGDQALALARRSADDPQASAAAWTAACEAWRSALLRGRVGESVSPRPVSNPGEVSPWPEPERGVQRSTQGLEESVLWRLSQLPAAGRTAWKGRFEALAQEALASAVLPESLLPIERGLPATTSAVRAALLLAEYAGERGESAAARRWLARGRRHLALLEPPDAALLAALERREQRFPREPEPAAEIWQRAEALEFVALRALEAPRGQTPRVRALGSGPQAGMQALDERRELLQTPGALWWLEAQTAQLRGPFENNSWLAAAGLQVDPAIAPGDGPGWRLDPAVQASSAVVVAGRSVGGESNVLACVDCPGEATAPRLRWALAADAASLASGDGADEGEDFEFQPGPLWRDGLVIVLRSRSRAAVGEREIELLALEAQGGQLRWRAFLGKGGERTRDMGRFARRGTASLPAEPLLAAEGGIFASAQLGFGALVDPLDGRLRYSLRNRRRAEEERGWPGWGASPGDSGRLIAWAPADSDHLYLLDGAEAPQGPSPLLAEPQAIGEAEALVAADRGTALLLSRTGARRSLASWERTSGERQDALRLGPEEVFAGRAVASSARVLACSDRALYLFDRERELRLLAVASLQGGVPRGGNVWARGPWVFVLSNRTIEIFRAR